MRSRAFHVLAACSGVALLSAVFAGCKRDETKGAPEAGDAAAGAAEKALPPIELPPGDGPVATVNGVAIPREPFNKEYRTTMERYQRARHEVQPALRERLKDNIVRRLVEAEVIRQQAEKMSVAVSAQERDEQWDAHRKRYGSDDAFKAFLERAGTTAEDVRMQFEANLLREKVFAKVSDTITVAPEEVKDFFDKNQARYDEPEQVQASHILIRLSPGAPPDEKAQKKQRAEEALKKVKAKGADFAALAKEYGEDPTKDRGGDLGYFTKGRMVKPFEDAVWSMKPGQTSGVVETQFGYHIIKKIDHKPGRKKPFQEAKEQIERSLQAKKRNEAIRDSLTKWRTDAKIEIFVKGDEAVINAPSTPVPALPNGQPAVTPREPGAKVIQEGLKIRPIARPDTRDAPVSQPAH